MRYPTFPTVNPLQVWANSMELAMLLAEAQAVIAMRLMGMSGFWSVTPSENRRMVAEKTHALTRAMTATARAGLAGADPAKVAAASIRPFRQKTRANVRRLGKRGPKLR